MRFVGVSNYDAAQMAAFQRARPIDTLQPPDHLFRRDIERSILPFAREHGIGVLVYGPLAHGLFSGRTTEGTTFAPDDWRSGSDLFTGEAFSRNVAIVRDPAAFAASRNATVAQLAIAWTLGEPGRGRRHRRHPQRSAAPRDRRGGRPAARRGTILARWSYSSVARSQSAVRRPRRCPGPRPTFGADAG